MANGNEVPGIESASGSPSNSARKARVGELRAWAAAGFADLDAGRVSELTVDDIKRTARERFLG